MNDSLLLQDHFDLRGDGRVHFQEFVYELLQLPMPKEIATQIPPRQCVATGFSVQLAHSVCAVGKDWHDLHSL